MIRKGKRRRDVTIEEREVTGRMEKGKGEEGERGERNGRKGVKRW